MLDVVVRGQDTAKVTSLLSEPNSHDAADDVGDGMRFVQCKCQMHGLRRRRRLRA